MYYYQYQYQRPDELYHYGVKGMRWGVRRYQNEDGSLTSAGQRHRSDREGGSYSGGSSRGSSGGKSKKSDRSRKIKKALGLTLGTAATAAAAYYGGRKLGSYLVNKHYGSGSGTDRAMQRFANSIDRIKDKSRIWNRNTKNNIKRGVSTTGLRLRNRANMTYQDAKSKYKNSSLGRRIATERFKYQNGLSAANRVGERAALYGNKARRGVTDAAYRVGERAALYGHKAGSATKNARLRGSIAYNNARRKAWDTAGNIIRKRKAKKIRYTGF